MTSARAFLLPRSDAAFSTAAAYLLACRGMPFETGLFELDLAAITESTCSPSLCSARPAFTRFTVLRGNSSSCAARHRNKE